MRGRRQRRHAPVGTGRRLAAWLALVLLGGLPTAVPAQFEGLWKGRFAGVALDIAGRDVTLLQVSESHAWPLDEFRHDADGGFGTGDGRRYRLVLGEGRLEILDDREQVFLSFVPVDSLPPLTAPTTDPGVVFDVVWESFAENHALFDLAGVDWAARRAEWRDLATAARTPAELFDALSGLLAPLNDRHTTLVRPEAGQIYRSGPASDPFWRGRENEFLANIAEHYLGAPLRSRQADPRLRFGVLPDGIGYLSVSNFLDRAGAPPFSSTLDRVLEDLADTRGLVVDFRFNPGGVDRNTLAFLERLLPPGRTLAYARERRLTGPLPAIFDAPELQALAPRDNPFHQHPLAVLTASDTASAAETVLLALLGLPRAVQVGETTAGVFSNLLVRYYPNGWYGTLSNERYLSLNGVSYEQRGISPQVAVNRDGYDFVRGVDPALEAAIAAVRAQPERPSAPRSPGDAVSGLWFDPARSGEGWHLQRVDAERVFVTFYGFDPDGSGAQDWFVGLGEDRDGELVVDELVTGRGGYFGADDGAAPIEILPWGRARIRFDGCDGAVAEVEGPDSHRGFVFRLEALSRVPGLGCGAAGTVEAPAAAGSWYVPERPGEGWLVSPSAPGQVVVSWYTFDEDGRRRWLVGTGEVNGAVGITAPSLYDAAGADWGHDFAPADAVLEDRGALVLELETCDRARITFTRPGEPPTRFPAGRLTRLQGLDYPDGCD